MTRPRRSPSASRTSIRRVARPSERQVSSRQTPTWTVPGLGERDPDFDLRYRSFMVLSARDAAVQTRRPGESLDDSFGRLIEKHLNDNEPEMAEFFDAARGLERTAGELGL